MKLIHQKEQALASAPAGSLRITHCKKHIRYYLYTSSSEKPRYLKDKKFICRLAQKNYDQKILQTAHKEYHLLHVLLERYPNPGCEEVIQIIPAFRAELITPIQLSDEEYLEKWCLKSYEPKKFSDEVPEYYTDRNERVRSKSEILIANYLSKKEVSYKYECPLKLNGIGTIYPDFTVLNVRTRTVFYHEHFGMMDSPDYAEQALRRIHAYENNGIFPGEQLICTFETRTSPLNIKILKKIVAHFYM